MRQVERGRWRWRQQRWMEQAVDRRLAGVQSRRESGSLSHRCIELLGAQLA